VVAEAVGLHHEAEGGPEEVDFEAVDELFAERRRQSRGGRDWTEEDLEIGVGKAEGESVEQLAQWPDARLAGIPMEGAPERLGVDQIALVSVVDRALEGKRIEFDR
jgi:hypothetical protein